MTCADDASSKTSVGCSSPKGFSAVAAEGNVTSADSTSAGGPFGGVWLDAEFSAAEDGRSSSNVIGSGGTASGGSSLNGCGGDAADDRALSAAAASAGGSLGGTSAGGKSMVAADGKATSVTADWSDATCRAFDRPVADLGVMRPVRGFDISLYLLDFSEVRGNFSRRACPCFDFQAFAVGFAGLPPFILSRPL